LPELEKTLRFVARTELMLSMSAETAYSGSTSCRIEPRIGSGEIGGLSNVFKLFLRKTLLLGENQKRIKSVVERDDNGLTNRSAELFK
jgi:hypothetical protein